MDQQDRLRDIIHSVKQAAGGEPHIFVTIVGHAICYDAAVAMGGVESTTRRWDDKRSALYEHRFVMLNDGNVEVIIHATAKKVEVVQ